MRKNLLAAALMASVLGTAAMADDTAPQVQRKSMTQETYNQNTTAGQPGYPGAGAQVNTPVGSAGAAAAAPTIQASSATTGIPVAQRTVTTEETVMAQQNPPIRWSKLEGEVTHVDKVNNVVEIRLKGSKQTIGVPVVEKRVGIYRHGDHQYALKDIEPGDDVTLRNLNTAAPM